MSEQALGVAWWEAALTSREENVLRLRLDHTLDDTGANLGLSRERVRQIEKAAVERLERKLRQDASAEIAMLNELLGQGVAVADSDVESCLYPDSHEHLLVMLSVLDVVRPRSWAGVLDGWWTRDARALDRALRGLTGNAPFLDRELRPLAEAVGLPEALPLVPLLDHPASPVVSHPAGPWWVRRRAVHRDAAYLWLAEQGAPARLSDVATRVGIAENAMREAMRRDDRFVQLRPTGTWALAEWHLSGDGYRSALEAVIGILSDRGPLPYTELVREMRQWYPVTTWRIDQCLTSDRVGRMSDGRVGLVSDGAALVDEREPSRPDNVAVSPDGQLVAIKIKVDDDLLRGSGLPMPRYVAWRLGLRHSPDSRSFVMEDVDEEICVTKRTSGTQVTALRRFAIPLGVTEGCTLALLLRLDTASARLIHGCAPEDCPAGIG